MAPVVGAQSIADIRCRVTALDALVGVAMVAPAGCAVAGGNTVPGAVGDAVHACIPSTTGLPFRHRGVALAVDALASLWP